MTDEIEMNGANLLTLGKNTLELQPEQQVSRPAGGTQVNNQICHTRVRNEMEDSTHTSKHQPPVKAINMCCVGTMQC